MKTYKVKVSETLSRLIEVVAHTEAEALQNIENRYRNEEIILDSDDFKGYSVEIMSE